MQCRILISKVFNKDTSPPPLNHYGCIPSVPPLCDPCLRNRVISLEAFRRVLIRRPGCPASIGQVAPLTNPSMTDVAIEACERMMFRFYCQMFWIQAGRAPLVPHFFPA